MHIEMDRQTQVEVEKEEVNTRSRRPKQTGTAGKYTDRYKNRVGETESCGKHGKRSIKNGNMHENRQA